MFNCCIYSGYPNSSEQVQSAPGLKSSLQAMDAADQLKVLLLALIKKKKKKSVSVWTLETDKVHVYVCQLMSAAG